MTPEEAGFYFESGEWNWLSDHQRAELQMEVKYLCMPFSIFHGSIERTLGRPVFTHEFGLNWDGLLEELQGRRPQATFSEVMDLLLDTGKPVMFAVPQEDGGFTLVEHSDANG